MRHRTSSWPLMYSELAIVGVLFQSLLGWVFVSLLAGFERVELLQLPTAELAQPQDAAEVPLTLRLTAAGTVLVAGDEVGLEAVEPFLVREAQLAEIKGQTLSTTTIVIRAPRDLPAGRVQELIRLCQRHRFDKFVLRIHGPAGT